MRCAEPTSASPGTPPSIASSAVSWPARFHAKARRRKEGNPLRIREEGGLCRQARPSHVLASSVLCAFAPLCLCVRRFPLAMFILLANDDGIEAPGLHALAAALGELSGVRLAVVAPAKNRTGSGTQIEFGPLTVLAHPPVGGWPAWAVDGSPLDAVSVGIQGLFRE